MSKIFLSEDKVNGIQNGFPCKSQLSILRKLYLKPKIFFIVLFCFCKTTTWGNKQKNTNVEDHLSLLRLTLYPASKVSTYCRKSMTPVYRCSCWCRLLWILDLSWRFTLDFLELLILYLCRNAAYIYSFIHIH